LTLTFQSLQGVTGLNDESGTSSRGSGVERGRHDPHDMQTSFGSMPGQLSAMHGGARRWVRFAAQDAMK